MEGVPDLGEEGIHLGPAAVVPALALAYIAPVAAFQHKPGAGFEFVAEGTFKFQGCFPVSGFHFRAEQSAAAEGCGSGHILLCQLAFRFGFVVAVVNGDYRIPLGKMGHLGQLFRQGFPFFPAAPVGIYLVFQVFLNKMHGAVFRFCQLVKSFVQDDSHQPLTAGKAAQHPGCLGQCPQLGKITIEKIRHGILPEVEIMLQLVAVQIVLPMKIPCCKLLGMKHIIQLGQADGTEHPPEQIIGADPAAFPAANVVDMPPKAFVQGAILTESTQIPHRPGRVPVRAVFQHIVQAVVEYDGILNRCHGISHHAGLPQGNPVL